MKFIDDSEGLLAMTMQVEGVSQEMCLMQSEIVRDISVIRRLYEEEMEREE